MKIIHKNKKAYFDYEIIDEFIAGIQLTGSEVKSIRDGKINLKGSYISIKEGILKLKNAHISAYPYNQSKEEDPLRDRLLLLNKREVNKIESATNEQGVTIIALSVGQQGRYLKLKIAVAKGKRKYDKRHSIKSRDDKRKMARISKNYL